MIEHIALIPARKGSKGIPNKNLIDLCGKPLIYYSIKASKKGIKIFGLEVSIVRV